MKRIIAILFSLSMPSFGAIAHVQSNATGTVNAVGGSCVVAYGSNVTAGSLLIGYNYTGTVASTMTASDSLGQTWVLARNQPQSTDGHLIGIFYFKNTAGGANTVTFTDTGGTPSARCSVSEYSGADTTSPLDQVNGAQGNGTAAASGSITPGQNGELLIGIVGNSAATTFTAGTDFTKRVNVPDATSTRLGGEEYIQPTAASHDGTWTLGAITDWSAAIASFKPAAAATTSACPRGNMLGIGCF